MSNNFSFHIDGSPLPSRNPLSYLCVRDGVEDLIDLAGMVDLDLDGVRGLEAIQCQACGGGWVLEHARTW